MSLLSAPLTTKRVVPEVPPVSCVTEGHPWLCLSLGSLVDKTNEGHTISLTALLKEPNETTQVDFVKRQHNTAGIRGVAYFVWSRFSPWGLSTCLGLTLTPP